MRLRWGLVAVCYVTRWRTWIAIGVVYTLVRLGMLASTGAPLEHPDTHSYRQGVSFIGADYRQWPVPIALDVFGELGFVVFQTIVAAVSLVVLAWAVSETMRARAVRISVVAGCLALGLSDHVAAWDAILLSESLALSLTALLLAALVRLDRCPWWVLAPLFALWVFVRDGHLYVGVFVIAGVAVWAWRRRNWILPTVMVAVMLWAGLAARNDRFVEQYNVVANIAYTGVRDTSQLHWFVERGMPVPQAFFIETDADRIRALYADDEYHEWLAADGEAMYARYVLAHPNLFRSALERLFIDGGRERESVVDHTYRDDGDPISLDLVWPDQASWYTCLLCIVALMWSLLIARRHRLDGRWWIPALTAASSIPHVLLVVLASPFEIARHGAVLAFGLVVAAWWVIALCVDAWLASDRVAVEVVERIGSVAQPDVVAGGDLRTAGVCDRSDERPVMVKP